MGKHRGKYVSRTKKTYKVMYILSIFGLITLVAGIYVMCLEENNNNQMNPELFTSVTIEAGSAIPPAYAFAPRGMETNIEYGSGISHVDNCIPGKYSVELILEGDTRVGNIVVVDTIPPKAITRDLCVKQDEMPVAGDFIVDIQDFTDVTVRFKTEPDKNCGDVQNVTLIVTDSSGNWSEANAMLTVIIDQEAPEIEGVQDVEVYQGETVAYRSGVSVTDNRDDSPVLEVDSSKVDLTLPGVYEVVYSATDSAGNRTEVIAKVTVLEKKKNYVELERIYEKADQILSRIIEDNMSDEEQVRAIYYYIRKNYGYINSSDKEDWRQAAYKMMEIRCGDCFGYFSLFKLLLERLEIPNIDVVKVKNYEGDSSHFWSLVSVDGGKTYYHVDATHRSNDPTEFLLVTDSFLDAYSARHNNCFNRDQSLYPATPEEGL